MILTIRRLQHGLWTCGMTVGRFHSYSEVSNWSHRYEENFIGSINPEKAL